MNYFEPTGEHDLTCAQVEWIGALMNGETYFRGGSYYRMAERLRERRLITFAAKERSTGYIATLDWSKFTKVKQLNFGKVYDLAR